MMFAPILLITAMLSPEARPVSPALARASVFRPASSATARATVSIRIVSGAKFGSSYSGEAPGAVRRAARLTDRDGQLLAIELLEFQ